MSSNAEQRIGDLERERAVSDLGDHFVAGRLTRDELDERLGRAWQARTGVDLQPLFADLPGQDVVPRQRPRAPTAEPGPGGKRGFPLLLLLVLAIILTVTTEMPIVLVLVGWFVLSRIVGGHRRPCAIGR